MTDIFCPKCGFIHSFEELSKSHFCKKCGKYITSQIIETSTKPPLIQDYSLNDRKENDQKTDLEKTYWSIRKITPQANLVDSLEVVKAVEAYRQFWKPKQVKVILLAESHVFTTQEEYSLQLKSNWLQRLMSSESVNYPKNFVRFVYCLGYGENSLLDNWLKSNQGTWQFWKMFSYCVGIAEFNVSKTSNPYFGSRLLSKVKILKLMKDRGIWLLDTSIVGLYRSGVKSYPELLNRIILTSWRDYVQRIVEESDPKHVIVVGKAVELAVKYDLKRLNIDYTSIEAPQARLNSEKQQANYEKYRELCQKYC